MSATLTGGTGPRVKGCGDQDAGGAGRAGGGAPPEPIVWDAAGKFKKVLVDIFVRWSSDPFIKIPILIREMFR